MKIQINKLSIFIVLGCLFVSGIFAVENYESQYASFQTSIKNNDDAAALKVGDSLFNHLATVYRADAGFGALKSKLMASEFLSQQMIQQLQKATGNQMYMMTAELLNKSASAANNNQDPRDLSLAPAKSYYDTSTEVFLKPVDISNLSEKELEFVQSYYNLKLRILTTNVAKAGQALSIARPDFKDTHHYVLVLPLLHFIEPKEIPLEVLPKWMRNSKQLGQFSDSCLLHYGLCFHAMSFARRASQINNESFSELQFYQSAAEKYKQEIPYIAVDCLKRSMELDDKNPEHQIAILQEVVQVWIDSANYDLAASEAKSLISKYGDHPESAESYWLYFYALSRANNSRAIINEIDKALEDPKCQPYRAKMLYIKWWALRRQRDQMPRVAALEYELLKLYADNPMVAPIMLSRATDLLAGQDYNSAYEMLNQLNEKFPNTQAARQAQRILEKLKTLIN